MRTGRNRGNQGAGIYVATSEGVDHTFKLPEPIERVLHEYRCPIPPGAIHIRIGHGRYGTINGEEGQNNLGPFRSQSGTSKVVASHNGTVYNYLNIRPTLEQAGYTFRSNIDSEVIPHTYAFVDSVCREAAPHLDIFPKLEIASTFWQGSYSCVLEIEGRLFGLRSPSGNRPLFQGVTAEGVYGFASESTSLEAGNFQNISEVPPGTIVEATQNGFVDYRLTKNPEPIAFCAMEWVYNLRWNTKIKNVEAGDVRYALGAQLAEQIPLTKISEKYGVSVNDILVAPIPNTAIPFAHGYLDAQSAPQVGCELFGVRKKHERAYQAASADASTRVDNVEKKLVLNDDINLEGKILVLIEDSSIEGNSFEGAIKVIRNSAKAQPRAIVLLVGSSMVKYDCFYGMSMRPNNFIAVETLITNSALLQWERTTAEMAHRVRADYIEFLHLPDFLRILRAHGHTEVCASCFDNSTPLGRPSNELVTLEQMQAQVERLAQSFT